MTLHKKVEDLRITLELVKLNTSDRASLARAVKGKVKDMPKFQCRGGRYVGYGMNPMDAVVDLDLSRCVYVESLTDGKP